MNLNVESNPRLIDTLITEQRKHGGMNEKSFRGGDHSVTIFGGPYAGTYSFRLGNVRVVYQPSLQATLSRIEGKIHVKNKEQNKLLCFLAPYIQLIVKVLPQSGVDGERRVVEYHNTVSYVEGKQKEQAELRQQTTAPPRSRTDDGTFITYYGDPRGSLLTTAVVGLAETLALFLAWSGLPFDQVAADLYQEPRRILSIQEVRPMLSRIALDLKERRTFARALLTTWSPRRAWNVLFPTVEGGGAKVIAVGLPLLRPSAREVKRVLGKVPSWQQQLTKFSTGHSHGLQLLISHGRGLTELGLRAAEVRKVLKDFNPDQVDMLKDALMQARQVEEALGETVEGRRVLVHIANRDWKQVVRDHDFISNVYRMHAGEGPQDRKFEAWHARGREFNLPRGVRPLVTRPDFNREGVEMDNCVASYFPQNRSLLFAFEDPETKERATLELAQQGHVAQFFGPRNTRVGSRLTQKLKRFLADNQEAIKGLRQPVKR